MKRRRTIKNSLTAWSRECGYEPALHHQLLIATLEKAARREIRRIIFTLPPNSAKSTYSSYLFPAWFPGQCPGQKILACSHNADLVYSFGKHTRDTILEKQNVLGYSIKPTTKAVDNWETTNGVEYRAAGVGAGISGFRANLGLIDDPVGKKEDADSELFRKKLWDWYVWEFRKRIDPEGVIVIIQTRWHEDDLAGRLIREEGLASDGGEWTLINIPLIAVENDPLGRRPGEVLWPERFTTQHVLDAKKDARAFNCLEQGNPEPEEGNFFKKAWLDAGEYEQRELPKDLRYYAVSDHALSTKTTDCRSCLVPFGVDDKGTVWILPDIRWERFDDTGALVNAMIDIMKQREPITWWAENEHISKSIGPFLQERMLARKVFCNVEGITPSRDPMTRAQAINGRMSMLTVKFPKNAPWWGAARKEILAFPQGKFSDFVSALSLIGLGLRRLTPASVPEPEKKVETLTFGWLKESCRMKDLHERYANADN